MDYKNIIEELRKYKTFLQVDVVNAYDSRGRHYGGQRYDAWKKEFNKFLDNQLLGESENLSRKLYKIVVAVKPGESDVEMFWREDGDIIVSYIDSLILDLSSGNYHPIEASNEKNTGNSTDIDVKYPDKVTISWLMNHVSMELWWMFFGFLAAALGVGIVVGQSKFYATYSQGNKSIENPRTPNKAKNQIKKLNQAKTNTDKLKTELEECQTKNNDLSKSLQQANNGIKNLIQVKDLQKENKFIWNKIESIRNKLCNGCDRTQDYKKIEDFKIQSNQIEQEINILLSCTSSN